MGLKRNSVTQQAPVRRGGKLHPVWMLASLGFIAGIVLPFVLPFDLVPSPPGSKQNSKSTLAPAATPAKKKAKWTLPSLSKTAVAETQVRAGPKGAKIRTERAGSKVTAEVLPGTRLWVVEMEGSWLKVRYGRRGEGGWLQREETRPLSQN